MDICPKLRYNIISTLQNRFTEFGTAAVPLLGKARAPTIKSQRSPGYQKGALYMTAIIMDEYVLPTLVRYRDQYHWSWNRSARLINMYYGTEYTEKQLKKLYRKKK